MSAEPDPAEKPEPRPTCRPSGFTCPECSGALWELREAELRALPLPRRALLLRGRDGRRAGHGRRGRAVDARSRCSRSAASCCGGSATRMDGQPRTQSRFRTARARPRTARRRDPPHPCPAVDEAWPDERRAEDPAFEALLEFLKRSRGLDFTGYKRPSLQRRFRRRMETVGCAVLQRLPGLPRGPPRRVRAALRDAAHQRHRVLPRSRVVGAPARRGAARAAGREGRRRAGARVERGLRERPGGLHHGDGLRRADGRRGVPRAGEDLRHRHRRGRAQPGAAGDLQRQGDRVGSRGACASATSSAPTSGWRSARTSAARSSSAATTSSATRRSRGWTC